MTSTALINPLLITQHNDVFNERHIDINIIEIPN